MKELLQSFTAFNYWANQKITEVILQLPAEKLKTNVPGSFNSLHGTLFHMWNTESVWWQRIKLAEKIEMLADEEDTVKVVKGLLSQSKQWMEWVKEAPERSLQHVIQYQNSKRETFKQPVAEIVMHMVNHATYHRGQLINMMRQLGEEKLPATDYILWSRKK